MKTMTVLGFAAVMCLVLPQAAGEADGPDWWTVTDVADDDVLNIREAPDPHAKKTGEIPPNGTCIKNLGCVGGLTFEEFTSLSEEEKQRILRERPRWCKIEYQEVEGWVAGRYLTEAHCDTQE